jgi:hypothetical protein
MTNEIETEAEMIEREIASLSPEAIERPALASCAGARTC